MVSSMRPAEFIFFDNYNSVSMATNFIELEFENNVIISQIQLKFSNVTTYSI